ncbi:uncharacterized protein LOC131000839 [Salvia miltiorrhiza]|uniref:uncharacterized protein LOC131000839 n=1 Tax=Salvia miltiorrhiza TaxID=226208 RepID=UPI0025AC08F9|nr:uncharacterized protein LOC131000839 [Salvia miltiorrhiza]
MENVDPNVTRVQHVAKASSDQLLSKFAEVGSDSNRKIQAKDLRLAKRVKRNQECADNKSSVSALAERKSLLPPRKQPALMRRLGISRAKIKAREIKNKSIITAIEKTWRRTVEGASRVLMEKHYNRHKRLINDSY